jgi:Uma2 family endonuclease
MTTIAKNGIVEDRKKIEVPEKLIYEIVDGKPVYYKDYKKVLNSELPWEAVVGSGYLQARLIWLILSFLAKNMDTSKWEILTNEAGFLYAPGNYRSLDIAIFKKEKLKDYEKENYTGYVKVPPEVVIEIDTKAETDEVLSYIKEKIEDLLSADVKRIIWYFTDSKTVIIAEQGKDWIISDWDREIEIIDNLKINVQKLLEK